MKRRWGRTIRTWRQISATSGRSTASRANGPRPSRSIKARLGLTKKRWGRTTQQWRSSSATSRCFMKSNKYAAAEPLLRRALTIDEKGLGPDHPMVAALAEHLALTLGKLGRDAEAE